MKRLAVIIVAALVVTSVAVLVVAEIEVQATQPIQIVPHGFGSAGQLGARNFSVQFYLDRPGELAGSWGTSLEPTPSTALLYLTSQCREATSGAQGDVNCAGDPVWEGPKDVNQGSINFSAKSTTYTLVWESQNRSDSPFIWISTPIVLTPTPWWWA